MMSRTVTATTKYIRQSPQKVRAIANQVRQMPLDKAVEYLNVSNKKAATPVRKTLQSAIANATNNHDLAINQLNLKSIEVNTGPTFRRPNYRARGRLDIVRKRNCHIKVVLEQEEPTK